MNDLVKLTAREAVTLLANRSVSPLDLIDAALERIEETDKSINALPTLCVERARLHAQSLMREQTTENPSNYLYGLPIAVKDLTDVEGVRTTRGSPIFANHVPKRSDFLVQTLEANGAVVIGKSNTPEFGAGANTFNEVFGKTRNPWDIRLTPGGSSGGSAAALAAGQVWLATGSDLGGSLRIPASFTSVVGLRPSPGRVAHGPDELPFSTLSVQGPMGRTVGDVALMLDAQVGLHVGDPLSMAVPERSFLSAVDNPHLPSRIAFSPDLGIAPVDPEVVQICSNAALIFEHFGASVEQDCLDLEDAEAIFQTLRAGLYAAQHARLLQSNRDQLKPEVIWNIEKGLALTADDLGKAERARGALFQRASEFFQNYDLLVTPAVVVPPFDVDIRYITEVADGHFDTYVGWLVLSFAITVTGCPAISVPCGFTSKGLPVGLQLVARRGNEAELLSAASLFEKEAGLGGRVPIDPR